MDDRATLRGHREASIRLRARGLGVAGQHPLCGKPESMKKLTLHEAMEQVLLASGTRMSVEELAREIDKQGLYQRSDGVAAPAKQLYARAAKHSKFEVGDGEIWLR